MRRYQIRCAACLILLKEEQGSEYVLLQRRYNTGLHDGKWDLSSCGHLEKNETVMEAIIREIKEEIGIDIKKENLTFVELVHIKFPDAVYFMPVFKTTVYSGAIQIMEPNKCDKLEWFSINSLPDNIIDNRKQMIEDYQKNINYRELGW